METKNFTKNDEGFFCLNCGYKVVPAKVTSRNHCPQCLYSLHVDNKPGDRENECKGLMKPIGIQVNGKKGFVIIHQCEKCEEIRKNRALTDIHEQADNIDKIIELSKNPIV